MYAETAISMLTARDRSRTDLSNPRPCSHGPILLIEPEKETCEQIREHLQGRGYRVLTAPRRAVGEQLWGAFLPDLVIIDCALPDGSGLQLVSRFKQLDSSVRLVMLTGYGSLDRAAEAVKLGADLFLTKPVDLQALSSAVDRALEDQQDRRNQRLQRIYAQQNPLNPFVGTSDAVRKLADAAQWIASQNGSVLIEGEAGTGKGCLAEWLHGRSPRRFEPFVEVACRRRSHTTLEFQLFGRETAASLHDRQNKPGLLELAHRGTLFLDDIHHTNLRLQARLLELSRTHSNHVSTQGRPVDIRMIGASRESIPQLVAHKRFLGDFYSQSSRNYLVVPPLRDRTEDIPLVASEILGRLSAEMGRGDVELTRGACAALQCYRWPGNLRELRNALEHALLTSSGGILTEKHLNLSTQDKIAVSRSTARRTLEEIQRQHIEQVFRAEGGRVDAAAKRLGMPRSSLYHKLKQYQIDRFGMRPLSPVQTAPL